MKNIDSQIAELIKMAHAYVPNQEIQTALSSRTMIPIVGPSAIGKNTIIKQMTKLDDDFGRVRSFTTREHRPGEPEDAYFYRPYTEKELEKIKGQLEEGSLVQIAIFPTTQMVYGTTIESYEKPYSVIDFLASSIADLDALGFKEIMPVALVAQVDQWKHWLHERLSEVGKDDFEKRIREAVMSLEWTIANAEKIHIQHNPENFVQDTAQEVIDVCRKLKDMSHDATLAHEMLTFTKSLI